MRESTARWIVLGLVCLAPAVYLPRLVLGRRPADPRVTPPAWTHLVLVTVGRWPDLGASLDRPGLAAFDRRASRVTAAFAPSESSAACAASLWTGRYPRSHGVTSNDRALAEDLWTVAGAARAAGTRTAAFLQEPFVSATAIEGFDTVFEDPAAGGLVDAATAYLAEQRGERVLVWLHLAEAGPAGAAVEDALARLTQALEEGDRRPETSLVLAVLARGERADDGGADALAAPLWIQLAGALNVGRRGDAQLSLVDLPGFLLLFLGLPPPPDVPLSARGDLFWNALRGGGGRPGVVVQGETDLWRRGEERVVLDLDQGTARVERRAGGRWTALAGTEAQALLEAARAAAEDLTRTRSPAREARVPAGAWPPGWGD